MKKNKFLRILRVECQKAIKNKMFVVSLCIGGLFCVMSALYMIGTYQEDLAMASEFAGNAMTGIFSLYNYWIGGEWISSGFQLFFTMLPLLACIPYGWSLFSERKDGYIMNMAVRTGKRSYFLCKYIAVFMSGGLVVLLPMLFNLVMVAMYIPAIQPDINYIQYYSNEYGTMWSLLFYECPLLFCMLYLLLDFVFAGLFACMSMSAGMILQHKVAVVICPFLILLVLHYSRQFILWNRYIEISPINFLHASNLQGPTTWWIVLLEGLLLLGITYGISVKAGVKSEFIS